MSVHSPLGGSGAERWMNCAGSVALLALLDLSQSDEEDYTREGLGMHEVGADCLVTGKDPWEYVGETHCGAVMTAELTDPLLVYLDHCRPLMAATQTWGVEFRISSPVHPDFYGTTDFWAIAPGIVRPDKNALYVTDLKGGVGILVEVVNNPQGKYYAFGIVDTLERQRSYSLPDDMEVVITIAQPRGHHPDGPVRSWSTTVGEIKRWTHEVLVPAMERTATDKDLDAGSWCRFCPAKLVCPVLISLAKAAAVANPSIVGQMTDEQLGWNYRYADPIKIFLKAVLKDAQRRLEAGSSLPYSDTTQLKLVHQKANRVYREGARLLALQKFGAEALEAPLDRVYRGTPVDKIPSWLEAHIKSPAQLEKVPAASEWVKQFCFTPKGALTVVTPEDPRPAIDAKRLTDRYAGYVEGVDSPTEAGQDW